MCILPKFYYYFLFNFIDFPAFEQVHNIVLYPDKHSWCKTLPIKQVVSHPGYKSEEIDNHVCVGTCFSYSIPHTEPSDPGEVIVPYCDSCQPFDTTWHHVSTEYIHCSFCKCNDISFQVLVMLTAQSISALFKFFCHGNRLLYHRVIEYMFKIRISKQELTSEKKCFFETRIFFL